MGNNQNKFKRLMGNKRSKRSIEEKLRKYESHAEGYFFIPALMHSLERYCKDISNDSKTDLDLQLEKALDQIPNAKKILATAVKTHNEISNKLRRRIFSPKYLDLDINKGIDYRESERITQVSKDLTNSHVRILNPNFIDRYIKTIDIGSIHDSNIEYNEPISDMEDPLSDERDQYQEGLSSEYELSFTKLYCVDESDPETIFGFDVISDEIYVVFATITEEMIKSDKEAQAKKTPVYEDIDDGDTRPKNGDENLRIYGPLGPQVIDSDMLVTVSCFESDLEDSEEVTEQVRVALTAAAKAAAKAGGYGWLGAAACVIAIGVSYIIDMVGSDDQIDRTRDYFLDAGKASGLTTHVNPVLIAPLHFDGGDSDGIYDIYMKLRRV